MDDEKKLGNTYLDLILELQKNIYQQLKDTTGIDYKKLYVVRRTYTYGNVEVEGHNKNSVISKCDSYNTMVNMTCSGNFYRVVRYKLREDTIDPDTGNMEHKYPGYCIEISVKDDMGYIYGFGSDLAKYGPDLRGKVFEFKLSALKDKESQEYLSSINAIGHVITVVSRAVLSSSKNI